MNSKTTQKDMRDITVKKSKKTTMQKDVHDRTQRIKRMIKMLTKIAQRVKVPITIERTIETSKKISNSIEITEP